MARFVVIHEAPSGKETAHFCKTLGAALFRVWRYRHIETKCLEIHDTNIDEPVVRLKWSGV